ncbi:MAG TPA: hypothetical protein VGP72_13080 [Planctomycetota bacterium]|jgi:colicin import membrane protein
MQRLTHFATFLLFLAITAIICVPYASAAEPQKPDDAKKAEDAKKKADDAKKKAEDAKKKAEEAAKRADEPKNWSSRDASQTRSAESAIVLYIKDPKPKKNLEAEHYESKDCLLDDSLRVKLRGCSRIKIKSDGTDGRGWAPEWLQKAHNGAMLVLLTSDGSQVYQFEAKGKEGPKADAISQAADRILKWQTERKAAADAKAKAEAAKNPPPPPPKPEIPGLDGKTVAKKPDKPKVKEPQDE